MTAPASHSQPQISRDLDTVQRMQGRDPEGLRQLLADYGGRVQGALRREFRVLREPEIEEAMNTAAMSAWRSATTFDPDRGTLRAWFYVIARNAAVGILRRLERERRHVEVTAPDMSGFLAPSAGPTDSEGAAATDPEFLEELRGCIGKLTKMQRAVIEADLESSTEVVQAADLAASLGTSTNSIYVTRSTARKALRKCLATHGHRFGTPGDTEEAEG